MKEKTQSLNVFSKSSVGGLVCLITVSLRVATGFNIMGVMGVGV